MFKAQTRTLIKTGNSIAVTLPPHWIKEQGLQAKDEVVVFSGKHNVVIRPKKRKNDGNIPHNLTRHYDCLRDEILEEAGL